MLRKYEPRWFVVHDRWALPGGAEDLKDRYCAACRNLPRAVLPGCAGADDATKAALNNLDFDREGEATRRTYVRSLGARAPAQVAEDEALFSELRRPEQCECAFQRDRDALLWTLCSVERGLPDFGVIDHGAVLAPRPGERKRRRAEDTSGGGGAPAAAVLGGGALRRSADDEGQQCVTRVSLPPGVATVEIMLTMGGPWPAYVRGWKLPTQQLAGKIVQALVELGVLAISDTTYLLKQAAVAQA
jgi:DNA methyltransferase 1-associated protein 1